VDGIFLAASVLRRVTTTTFLHSGFLIRSCTMRPPTFPVAPSTIAEYCTFVCAAAAAIVTSHARGTKNTRKSASEVLLGRAISSHHFYFHAQVADFQDTLGICLLTERVRWANVGGEGSLWRRIETCY
jgi:hypothetical protein